MNAVGGSEQQKGYEEGGLREKSGLTGKVHEFTEDFLLWE